jgi:hypothetical protein
VNQQRRPSFWRAPVEPWQIMQAVVLIVGVIVVYFIDEHLVRWWFVCGALASVALVPLARRRESVDDDGEGAPRGKGAMLVALWLARAVGWMRRGMNAFWLSAIAGACIVLCIAIFRSRIEALGAAGGPALVLSAIGTYVAFRVRQ